MKSFTQKLKLHLNYTSIILLFISTIISAQVSMERDAIISVDRIWDRAQHNAFTSLITFNGKFYVTFRESAGHVSNINGTIRVIVSKDGQNWSSIAHLDMEGVDLRDPQLSITPDKRIMLNFGGSVYIGSKRISMSPFVSFSNKNGKKFSKPNPVEIDSKIKTKHDWFWKATWHKGISYSAVYQVTDSGTTLQLVKSNNGIEYEFVSNFELIGNPNETALVFTPDDKMIALIRREGGNGFGYIGASEYPYEKWELNELGVKLGGPNIITLPNGKLLCGTREYPPDFKKKMVIGLVQIDGYYQKLLSLPSGGDCSYPGLLIEDDILYISYYSSHEEKTAIYLSKVRLNKIIELTDKDITPEPFVTKNKDGIIELSCDLVSAKIFYTVDGSIPTLYSGNEFKNAFKIKKTSYLRAIAVGPKHLESNVFSILVGQDIFQEAFDHKKQYAEGLEYEYFTGEFTQVKDFNNLASSKSEICPTVSILNLGNNENFGYKFSGFINIPVDGMYTFYLVSNDGSIMKLNEDILINNDGDHGKREIESSISLKKGMHKISVKYFQMGGGSFLKLFWKGEDFDKEEIPADVFFH